ncbi:hypothetical protein ScPMuIL_003142 [Solemya velum]
MTTFKYRPLCSILPLSRQWLLDDIILKKNHGQLDRVWLSPGHLFISLDSGLRIVTFDTRSVDKTQDDEKRCLDLTCDSPVLDILVGRSIPNVAYIIHRNGSVQVWKFRSDFSWLLIQKFNLCTTPNTVITDVCLHPSQNAVYWCESNLSSLSNATVFCIYKRQLPEDEGKLKNKELGLAIALVHNCPYSQVFAATHGLFIVFRDVVLLWCLSANRITVYTGGPASGDSGLRSPPGSGFPVSGPQADRHTVQRESDCCIARSIHVLCLPQYPDSATVCCQQ